MDRNQVADGNFSAILPSLSARRAWIEMVILGGSLSVYAVALRKESVDRNARRLALSWGVSGRSPQGERG